MSTREALFLRIIPHVVSISRHCRPLVTIPGFDIVNGHGFDGFHNAVYGPPLGVITHIVVKDAKGTTKRYVPFGGLHCNP